jgi:hypothetical protein
VRRLKAGDVSREDNWAPESALETSPPPSSVLLLVLELLQEQRQRESASKGIFQIFRVLKFKGGVIPGARAMKLSSSQSVRGAGGRSARAVFLLASWKGRIE